MSFGVGGGAGDGLRFRTPALAACHTELARTDRLFFVAFNNKIAVLSFSSSTLRKHGGVSSAGAPGNGIKYYRCTLSGCTIALCALLARMLAVEWALSGGGDEQCGSRQPPADSPLILLSRSWALSGREYVRHHTFRHTPPHGLHLSCAICSPIWLSK